MKPGPQLGLFPPAPRTSAPRAGRPPAASRPAGVRVNVRPSVRAQRVDPADAFALGAALRAASEGVERVEVTVNANRRRVLSWRRSGDSLHLSVHHRVLDAPEQVLAVVLRRDEAAWAVLLERFEAAPPPASAPRSTLDPRGAVHDLTLPFQALNETLLDARFSLGPALALGWGRWPRVPPRRGLRLGSCSGQPPQIRLHPALDHAHVPEWFVSFVLYHELLHLVVPPKRGASSRRQVHPPEFMQLERRHPRYDEAMAWEAANVGRLVRRTAATVRRNLA
ncbi:MAG: M48 family metallopeptidase [Alphaproteobacteria bacterium]|nr:M48 family metallopeptidase [Alphaproteobacteria bacterium]